MKVSRPTYRDRNGKQKHCQCWRVDWSDRHGARRRLPAFPQKRESERAASMIQWLLSTNGKIIDPELQRWTESIPRSMRAKLAEWGVIADAGAGKALTEHLEDWRSSMEAQGTTAKQVDQQHNKVKRVFDDCKFISWTDIDAHTVGAYLMGLRKGDKGISNRTSNFYIQALGQFGRWMIRGRRVMGENPFQFLTKLNTATDRRHDRRALTQNEIDALLSTTGASEVCYNLCCDGNARSLCYRLALESGLRASELRSLTVASFDFEAATLTVQAAHSKHRRQDILPLRRDTAETIKQFCKGKLPAAPVFGLPSCPSATTRMFFADITAANIQWQKGGLFADFHSLRHTFISALVRSGATIKEAQTLARHSSPVLTLNIYSHVGLHDTRKAIEKLSHTQVREASGMEGKTA